MTDADILDWLNGRAFTLYRSRDPETGELSDYVVCVDEDARGWRTGLIGANVRHAVERAADETTAPRIETALLWACGHGKWAGDRECRECTADKSAAPRRHYVACNVHAGMDCNCPAGYPPGRPG